MKFDNVNRNATIDTLFEGFKGAKVNIRRVDPLLPSTLLPFGPTFKHFPDENRLNHAKSSFVNALQMALSAHREMSKGCVADPTETYLRYFPPNTQRVVEQALMSIIGAGGQGTGWMADPEYPLVISYERPRPDDAKTIPVTPGCENPDIGAFMTTNYGEDINGQHKVTWMTICESAFVRYPRSLQSYTCEELPEAADLSMAALSLTSLHEMMHWYANTERYVGISIIDFNVDYPGHIVDPSLYLKDGYGPVVAQELNNEWHQQSFLEEPDTRFLPI